MSPTATSVSSNELRTNLTLKATSEGNLELIQSEARQVSQFSTF